MDFEDEGLYQCEATNAIGQTPEKHQIQVQVQAKPRFKVNLLYKCFFLAYVFVFLKKFDISESLLRKLVLILFSQLFQKP